MPGGTGEVGPVAATSTRTTSWPPKSSPLVLHHSGSVPAGACPAGSCVVPVHSHACRIVLRVDRVDRGQRGQQQADAQPDGDGQDHQADNGLPAAADRQAQPEADHGVAPVSELTWPSRTTTSRSA